MPLVSRGERLPMHLTQEEVRLITDFRYCERHEQQQTLRMMRVFRELSQERRQRGNVLLFLRMP